MLDSEKLAIAAHLHVLLRRKVGRVTDTEWMTCNAEYACEIIRFTRQRAAQDGHPDLIEWADKLEQMFFGTPTAAPAGGVPTPSPSPSVSGSVLSSERPATPVADPVRVGLVSVPPAGSVAADRYVGRLR
jgi:hypothetical protein